MKTTQRVIYVQFGAGMHNHVNVAVVEVEDELLLFIWSNHNNNRNYDRIPWKKLLLSSQQLRCTFQR